MSSLKVTVQTPSGEPAGGVPLVIYRRQRVPPYSQRGFTDANGECAFGSLPPGRYIVSASTPFGPDDLAELRRDTPAVVERLFPDYVEIYERLGWGMFPAVDRVYVNARARVDLGWEPRYDFRHALDRLRAGENPWSTLATSVGAKGYHPVIVTDMDSCIGCAACAIICPDVVFTVYRKKRQPKAAATIE